MKNIHILPTENSSRLSYNKDGILELHRLQWRKNTQYIYITSDEEIKEGDYFIGFAVTDKKPYIGCASEYKARKKEKGKIILTTDQDLIKDGVQEIPDEFIEWFIKNPSCEFVRIEQYAYSKPNFGNYKIIIPKEEPKQETLEEVSRKYGELSYYGDEVDSFVRGSLFGAKWQEQNSDKKYSEEEVINLIKQALTYEPDDKIGALTDGKSYVRENNFNCWFEKFKKK